MDCYLEDSLPQSNTSTTTEIKKKNMTACEPVPLSVGLQTPSEDLNSVKSPTSIEIHPVHQGPMVRNLRTKRLWGIMIKRMEVIMWLVQPIAK